MKEALNNQINQALNNVISGISGTPETRPQQIGMAQVIRRYLQYTKDSKGHQLIIEAGTGVGKSFAYLTSLCEYIKANPDIKAVIGTNTLNLLEQLNTKDIPYIINYYPDIVFNTAKGRNNYLCLHKLKELDTDLFVDADVRKFQSKIYKWMKSTPTHEGEKSNIDFKYNSKLWGLVQSDPTGCLDNLCPYKKDCYFLKARNKLKNSNIIITNHALVLADYQQKILPDYNILILDEGHNFESNALSSLTTVVKSYEVQNIDFALNANLLQSAFRAAQVIEEINDLRSEIRLNADAYFESLEDRRYIKPETEVLGKRLITSLQQAEILVIKAGEKNKHQLIQKEATRLSERLSMLLHNIQVWTFQEHRDHVYWVADNSINYCPINVANELQLFWQTKNTIITSATLSVNGQFDSLKRSLGLDQKCYTLRYGSPFNYKEKSIVYQPAGAPEPSSSRYTSYVSKTIENIIKKKPEKTFALFTSYKMMEEVYEQLHDKYPGLNWLLQGTGSKEMLLNRFRGNPQSILFGTDAFWEGVDEDINCVIIAKLPFEVPTTPIKEAQYELVKSRGGNSFMELSIPRCAIKLKQGTGRLIRNANQKGIIVICDPRMQKPWGKIIKNTLPEMPWTDDLNSIDRYLSVG